MQVNPYGPHINWRHPFLSQILIPNERNKTPHKFFAQSLSMVG